MSRMSHVITSQNFDVSSQEVPGEFVVKLQQLHCPFQLNAAGGEVCEGSSACQQRFKDSMDSERSHIDGHMFHGFHVSSSHGRHLDTL